MLPAELKLSRQGQGRPGERRQRHKVEIPIVGDEKETLEWLSERTGWNETQVVKVAAILGANLVTLADDLIKAGWDDLDRGAGLQKPDARAMYRRLENDLLQIVSKAALQALIDRVRDEAGQLSVVEIERILEGQEAA